MVVSGRVPEVAGCGLSVKLGGGAEKVAFFFFGFEFRLFVLAMVL